MSLDQVECYDLRFPLGTRFVIVGPSGSCKTEFVMNLLKYQKIV
jgi:ABC-type polar amino acid transport system ATPase subunit